MKTVTSSSPKAKKVSKRTKQTPIAPAPAPIAPAPAPTPAPAETFSREDLNMIASSAFKSIYKLENEGFFDSVECNHKHGIPGKFLFHFIEELPENLWRGIRPTEQAIKKFYRDLDSELV